MNNSETALSLIRVLIVDDHGMVRFGLRAYIELVPALRVVGEAASGEQAIQLMETVTVDIVLMDLALPGVCPEPKHPPNFKTASVRPRHNFDQFFR